MGMITIWDKSTDAWGEEIMNYLQKPSNQYLMIQEVKIGGTRSSDLSIGKPLHNNQCPNS